MASAGCAMKDCPRGNCHQCQLRSAQEKAALLDDLNVRAFVALALVFCTGLLAVYAIVSLARHDHWEYWLVAPIPVIDVWLLRTLPRLMVEFDAARM